MSATEAVRGDQGREAVDEEKPWRARLRLHDELSARTALVYLVAFAVASTILRALLTTLVEAPTVFSDEVGYVKLAESIGRRGHFALFDDRGMSYSPLYPIVISPIYALGASAPTAYALIKVVNSLLLSLSVFPTYLIARSALLPRRLAVLVAGLSMLAPLMVYTSLTISENVAYPVCLFALWATINAIKAQSARHDAVALVLIGLATTARIQLIVLVPAALTAVLVAAVFRAHPGSNVLTSVVRAVRRHWVLFGTVFAGLVLYGAASLAGRDVASILGRYALVTRREPPDLGHFLDVLARHIAGVDLAVGVIPFIAALAAGYAFLRSRRRAQAAFAAVALSVTVWLLIEVAYDAAIFDGPGGDQPRIHERFLIYVTPLFLVALVAVSRAAVSPRVYAVAAAVAALLPLAIPFGTVINTTVGFESFGLSPYGRVEGGDLRPLPHATVAAVWAAATLALVYLYVRARLRTVAILLLLPFVVISSQARSRIASTSEYGRSLLPAHVDWVDRVRPEGDVVLITSNRNGTPELQTAYGNLSVDRLYYLCREWFGSEFGERHARIDNRGVLRDDGGRPLQAAYVVAPSNLLLQGRVVARNVPGGEVLVSQPGGRVTVPPSRGASLDCAVRAPLARNRERSRPGS